VTQIADHARSYWYAATFYRRATQRDRSNAIKILRSLTRSPYGRVAAHARALTKEIENDHRSRHH